MPRARTQSKPRTPRAPKQKTVDHYAHEGKKRKNNPPVGLVSSATDKLDGRTKYEHDPHIDPFLSWAGKAEGMSFEVPNVSLHVHERIDPQRIVKSFLKEDTGPRQTSLFEQPDNKPPLNRAIDFYSHEQDWTNRLIAGDSLLVMNSLLQKEGMAGKVQMVYIDPPYGIKYNSNFQPFVNRREVRDNNDGDIPAEPETLQAFRDTWELGIHSYLTYLRHRLLLARELLSDSGSCFVQISDENVHLVKNLMDEVFGCGNFVSLVVFRKTGSIASKTIGTITDFLILYAKDRTRQKFNKLFVQKDLREETSYKSLRLPDGSVRTLTEAERQSPNNLPAGARVFQATSLQSDGRSPDADYRFQFDGTDYEPNPKSHWKTSLTGLQNLAKKGRIIKSGKGIRYVRYFDDFPYTELTNAWMDVYAATEMRYVVETTPKVLQRCMLMTTEPGDLVLDPTCGSGTTAFVAEQWARRWITCDTSRVAVALARQRLMSAKFDFYQLSHPDEGVRSGFRYQTVPHLKLEHLANDEPPQQEPLYDQPSIDSTRTRVTGPFTVEAVPSLRTTPFAMPLTRVSATGTELSRYGETGRQSLWRDELKVTGIRATGNKFLTFARVEPTAGTRFVHAEGEVQDNGSTKRALISFGPDYGPLEQRQVEEAIKEARSLKPKPELVIFAAFHFDPEAAKDIDQIDWPGTTVLKAQMSVDLLTADLRKKRSSNQSYWLIGQPDVDVAKLKDGTYQVKVNGFDYYNPVTGEIESGGTNRIAMWFLDTDYDERSLLPEQVFFPMKDSKRDWTRLAKALNGVVDEEKLEAFVGTESLPFKAGEHKQVAVKIIDDRGIESFVIKKLP